MFNKFSHLITSPAPQPPRHLITICSRYLIGRRGTGDPKGGGFCLQKTHFLSTRLLWLGEGGEVVELSTRLFPFKWVTLETKSETTWTLAWAIKLRAPSLLSQLPWLIWVFRPNHWSVGPVPFSSPLLPPAAAACQSVLLLLIVGQPARFLGILFTGSRAAHSFIALQLLLFCISSGTLFYRRDQQRAFNKFPRNVES